MDTSAADTRAGTIRIEQFPAGLEDGRPDARTMGWFEAVRAGFHDGAPQPGHVEAYVAAYQADRRVLWGAYDDGARPGAWGPDIPVATYGSLANTMNVGGGRLLPTHQITAVTVRPTHRRRGLLRTMITTDLEQAAGSGFAVAALTASEATIYGRFGFGAAAFTRRVEVDVRERFALRTTPFGTMELVDPASMLELAPQIFAGFHGRTTGSLDRQFSYAQVASGRWQSEKPEPNPDLRVAVHFRPDGEPGGYVAYKFAGWHSEPHTMKVVDLVAASGASYRELWRYLGSIDLVQRIVWSAAPADDPLPWALSDPRGYSVTAEEDALWLRILDLWQRWKRAASSRTTRWLSPSGIRSAWLREGSGWTLPAGRHMWNGWIPRPRWTSPSTSMSWARSILGEPGGGPWPARDGWKATTPPSDVWTGCSRWPRRPTASRTSRRRTSRGRARCGVGNAGGKGRDARRPL